MKKKKESGSLVLKFLAELCLLCDPIAISDATVSTVPSTNFVLNLDPLIARAELPRRRSLRIKSSSSSSSSSAEDVVGVASLLSERVESGLRCLGDGRFEKEVMQELWAALLCLQYTR